jgi:cation:H+ antiporter
VSRLEGLVFVALLVVMTVGMVRLARRDVAQAAALGQELEQAREAPGGLPRNLFRVTMGLLLLVVGARVLVDGATGLALRFGVSDRVIGLTIVAMGTSLPELVSSLVAAFRKHPEIVAGNIIGSNIFNILGILGVGALLKPIEVSPAFLGADVWWMLGLTVVFAPILFWGRWARRLDGAVLLALLGTYLARLLSAPAA